MKFQRFDPAQVPDLMTWFADADQLRTWGGPTSGFRSRRPASARIPRSTASTVSRSSLKAGRSRLLDSAMCASDAAISGASASHRDGAAKVSERACSARWPAGASSSSGRATLAVRQQNQHRAHRLYLRLGFREEPYPEAMPQGMDAHYMIAPRLWIRPPRLGPDSMQLADVRRMAMALLGTTESPHHRYTSFAFGAVSTRPRPWTTACCTSSWMRKTATAWCGSTPARTRTRLGTKDRRASCRPWAGATGRRGPTPSHRMAT